NAPHFGCDATPNSSDDPRAPASKRVRCRGGIRRSEKLRLPQVWIRKRSCRPEKRHETASRSDKGDRCRVCAQAVPHEIPLMTSQSFAVALVGRDTSEHASPTE